MNLPALDPPITLELKPGIRLEYESGREDIKPQQAMAIELRLEMDL